MVCMGDIFVIFVILFDILLFGFLKFLKVFKFLGLFGTLGSIGAESMSACSLLDASTWSPRLSELVEAFQVSLLPYNLELNYDYWNYRMYVCPPKTTNPFVDLEERKGSGSFITSASR